VKSLTPTLIAGALAIACAMPLTLTAQEQPTDEGKQCQGRKGQGERQARMMSPEDRADRLSQVLGLTEEQTSAVAEILQSNREQMEAQRQSGERPSRESMKAMQESTTTAINDVLTAEQQARFEEIRARHAEKRGQRGERGERSQRFQRPAKQDPAQNGSV